MNFKIIISLIFLLLSISQAMNPFEGKLLRRKCLKGRRITGCKETLLEAYKRTEFSKSDLNVNNATTFMMLFTCNNKKYPEYLDECGGRLPQNTCFDERKHTEIIVHGYFEGACEAAWMLEMKDQLLHRDKYNVIIIDYTWGNQPDYDNSVKNAEVVGKQIAFMIHNLVKEVGYTLEKIHLVGHSLGAHVCGYAGYYVDQSVKQKVRRITGLDPAGPGFRGVPDKRRLDKTDAKWVDIIHTNGGGCLPLFFGYLDPMGHADFYPNGGSKQDSCIPYILQSFLKGDTAYASASLFPPMCYHKQSVQYYKASINPDKCQFIGVRCASYEEFRSRKCRSCGKDGSDCAVMGMDWDEYPGKDGNQSYYLDTALACPYCDNKGIQLEGFPLLPSGNKTKCFSKLLGFYSCRDK